jgi:ABC-type branched-subunit amino acid transport system ATPase component
MLENFQVDKKNYLELARSIINNPDTLLLDEPLAGVNPKLLKTC